MAFPEQIYKGATVIVDGEARRRDGRPFDLSGYSVKLVLSRGARRYTILGGLVDGKKGLFQVTVPKGLTQELEPGTWDYELWAENSDASEVYVFDQGQVDVLPRV